MRNLPLHFPLPIVFLTRAAVSSESEPGRRLLTIPATCNRLSRRRAICTACLKKKMCGAFFMLFSTDFKWSVAGKAGRGEYMLYKRPDTNLDCCCRASAYMVHTLTQWATGHPLYCMLNLLLCFWVVELTSMYGRAKGIALCDISAPRMARFKDIRFLFPVMLCYGLMKGYVYFVLIMC